MDSYPVSYGATLRWLCSCRPRVLAGWMLNNTWIAKASYHTKTHAKVKRIAQLHLDYSATVIFIPQWVADVLADSYTKTPLKLSQLLKRWWLHNGESKQHYLRCHSLNSYRISHCQHRSWFGNTACLVCSQIFQKRTSLMLFHT